MQLTGTCGINESSPEREIFDTELSRQEKRTISNKQPNAAPHAYRKR